MLFELILAMGVLVVSSTLQLWGRKKSACIGGSVFILLWVIFYKNSHFFYYKISILGCTWLVCMTLSRIIYKTYTRALGGVQLDIKDHQQKIQSLKITNRSLEEENQTLEQALLQKEAVYESLKELNKTLEFSKTIEVFSDLLSKLTHFQKGWLLMLDSSPSSKQHPLYYQLSPHQLPSPVDHPVNALEAFLTEDERRIFDKALQFEPENSINSIGAMMGLGLFHEGVPVGVLILQGCEENEREILQILGLQLSMEIKKALLYEEMHSFSIMDGLTSIYQRRHLMILLESELMRLTAQEEKCSIVMMDIDYFKKFNDQFGHLVGDILLRNLSQALQENLRPMDLMGRYGGEEFLIALPQTTLEEALQICERLREDIERKDFMVYEKHFKLTLSMGISHFPDDSEDLFSLVQMADQALYEAKQAGRNQIKFYQKENIKSF